MKRCSFSMYSFLTHGCFVSLRNFISVSNNPMKTLTTQKSIVWSELKYVWVTILKALFVSNNKGKRSSFGMYSFLIHGHFVCLKNFLLVSNNTMKTWTTQKSIVWSEFKYVWVTTLKALFVSNNKGKRCSFLQQQMHGCSVTYR